MTSTPLDAAGLAEAAKAVAKLGPDMLKDAAWHELPDYARDMYMAEAEAAIRAYLASAEPAGWRTDMENAPRDGKPFFVWGFGYEWPEVIKWFDFSEKDAKEVGEPGYFHYADENLQEICDPLDLFVDFTHWTRATAAPTPQGNETK